GGRRGWCGSVRQRRVAGDCGLTRIAIPARHEIRHERHVFVEQRWTGRKVFGIVVFQNGADDGAFGERRRGCCQRGKTHNTKRFAASELVGHVEPLEVRIPNYELVLREVLYMSHNADVYSMNDVPGP